MDPDQIHRCFTALRAAIPNPKTELNYGSPFQLLVAVVLSAQSTDKVVNTCTQTLFATAPTPDAMVALGEDGIKAHIRRLGLFNAKARHVHALAQQLLALHGGAVPADREALEALPGVGRKTANVVLNTHFGQPTIAVDTHIFRVGNRIGIAPGKTPLAVEQALLAAVPAEYVQDAHHLLILHGRYTCMAKRPRCGHCRLFQCCEWPDKNQWAAKSS
ncbi:DNA glycosylase and apyrimidinic (AP) lyase (endonuclease III) [Acidithiobacillus ferrivorans]|uniref:Endonuclease III n=1 Tax=Acidithiobacillus ferrivorans TaxID=160808 RepID=A0A060UMT8_9PROT|nr:endonuclease III [Acidithiobacillus ferrivorans]CDQ09621.1 Endonuclease III (DNA-(apurinic or apyrimidinic site) lyase) [Acidithiobacillus ferrivorans]SMH67135.1 DNA glycosylase and apyrimidinic (AP) lyase (endonuclease III) [Acidithiobacillus ferrivorans]